MPRTVDLDELAAGTLDAEGTATVSIGPVARQIWQVATISLQVTPPAGVTELAPSEARAYVRGSYLAGTYDGNNDTADVSVRLLPGATLDVTWTAGTPGARCTVAVRGEMRVP